MTSDTSFARLQAADVAGLDDTTLAEFAEHTRKTLVNGLNFGKKYELTCKMMSAARAEQARRDDLALRTFPPHPLPAAEYQQRTDRAHRRIARLNRIDREREETTRRRAAIDAADTAAETAPDTITELPPSDKPTTLLANGRIVLVGSWTSWTLTTAGGVAIVSSRDLRDQDNPNRAGKVTRTEIRDLADQLATITTRRGHRVPFTLPGREWVAGFRDRHGDEVSVAVGRIVADWAAGLSRPVELVGRIAHTVDRAPAGIPAMPGVSDGDGFRPGEKYEDLAAGDEVDLDGTVFTIAEVRTEKVGYRREVEPTLVFTDGTKYQLPRGWVSLRVRYRVDPETPEALQAPGMGHTPTPLGVSRARLDTEQAANLDRGIPSPLPEGTRVVYTPANTGLRCDYDDYRPRAGVARDRFVRFPEGAWAQVVEYVDGTFDAINMSAMSSPVLVVDPDDKMYADACAQWGVDT